MTGRVDATMPPSAPAEVDPVASQAPATAEPGNRPEPADQPADAATGQDLPGLAGAAAASVARRSRAEFKRQLDFSGAALQRAIDACHAPEGVHLRRMPVAELLAAMPGLGPRRAEELMAKAGIPNGRRLAGIGHLQAARLVELIDARAARRRSGANGQAS